MEIIFILLIVIAFAVVKIAKNSAPQVEAIPKPLTKEETETLMLDWYGRKPSGWSIVDVAADGSTITSPGSNHRNVHMILIEGEGDTYVIAGSINVLNDKRKSSTATLINKNSQTISFAAVPMGGGHEFNKYLLYGDSDLLSDKERKQQALIKVLEFVKDQNEVTIILEDDGGGHAEEKLYVHDHSGVLDRFDHFLENNQKD